jgi:hypothetical protein
MDDWLKYYAETESRITSWSKFLADNDLIWGVDKVFVLIGYHVFSQ